MEEPKEGAPSGAGHFLRRNRRAILFWTILFLIVVAGYHLDVDRPLVAATALLWGIVTQIFTAAFAFVLPLIGATPLVGPVLIKIITIPLFWLINGLAFISSLIGLKIGHKRRVFESRLAATILMIGILIGYILGKIF